MLCTNKATFWVALDFLSEVLDVPKNDMGPADHNHSPAVPSSTPSNENGAPLQWIGTIKET